MSKGPSRDIIFRAYASILSEPIRSLRGVKVKKQYETPDTENAGGTMRALFDMEQGIERTPPRFKAILGVLLDRIIEKRLEYYIPLEDDEEDVGDTFRGFSRSG